METLLRLSAVRPLHTAGLARLLHFGAVVASVHLFAAVGKARGAELDIQIAVEFNGSPLVFDSLTNRTGAGQVISVTRLDFLMSGFALRREDGSWFNAKDRQSYISARGGRTGFHLADIPAGRYEAVAFLVGLTAEVNRADPAQYPPDHPLNPNLNGLYWGWQGGYVFMAIEGNWRAGSVDRGYSFHLANDPQLMTVELPLRLELQAKHQLRLRLNVARIFDGPHRITLVESAGATHSRPNDFLALQLHRNAENAFTVEGLAGPPLPGATPGRPALAPAAQARGPVPVRPAVIAPGATPYGLTVSRFFPRPALPLDNPLTEQGVALGHKLFSDPRLSINNARSCASCHRPEAAFSEAKPLSTGAEGRSGTRNAPALFNLAWKSSFFWDGRSATLRQQVLQPIQNPVEMHETLTNLTAKLARTEYPPLFEKAFGDREVGAERIARALEQFLLTQVSQASKFDRVLAGEAAFSAEERRGFDLFHTEYDPRREQFGADCFHCHGGPLFQSQAFANNGLDSEPGDPGRYAVTKRDGDRGKFAVPSLRNIAVTGPYMHDGRFQTLDEAVEHYSTGVKRSPTLDPNLAKHPEGGVPLSREDKKALVAFLKTLTDERFRSHGNEIVNVP